jgi:hypothetical protein
LVEENNEDIPQLLVEESNILTSDFDIEEVKEEIMQIERNKTLGPNRLPAKFYKKKLRGH